MANIKKQKVRAYCVDCGTEEVPDKAGNCPNCGAYIATIGGKKCPHSNCDDDGNCHKCGKSALKQGIIYNPSVHKQLKHDKVVSIVPSRDGLWRELVGVYWKGTDGSEVLFETTPSKAAKIVEIFNARA